MLKSAQTAAASRSACVGDAGGARLVGVRRRQLVGPRGRASRGRRGWPCSSGRSGAVRQSRTTACQTSSPSAYDATAPWEPVQNGHWLRSEVNAGEELSLAGAPLGRAAHHPVELLRERPPEELGPVEERLRRRRAARARCARARPRRNAASSAAWPWSTTSRRIIRSPPSPRRAGGAPRRSPPPTVCSKISSSLRPAAFRASTSASVTAYARSRTFSRYGAMRGRRGRAATTARSSGNPLAHRFQATERRAPRTRRGPGRP